MTKTPFALIRIGVLIAAILITACSPSTDKGAWRFQKSKDKITDAESYSFKNTSRDGKSSLLLGCSSHHSISLFFLTQSWLGESSSGMIYNLRAGSKEAIMQRWISWDKTASPIRDNLIPEFVRYVGDETKLVVRAQTKTYHYDVDFDVKGTAEAFAKLNEICKP